jgi:uncharacterized heparinase superfamily protein
MVAWVGIVAASLLMPGGEPRQVFGEAGLRKVLETSFYADGGAISRSPQAQLDAIMALSMLAKIYDMRRMEVPPFIQEVLARTVPALLGLLHSDGGMGSWQGSGATSAAYVQAIVDASGVRTRPLKQARDWGYQRLVVNKVVLLADAAPPPIARVTEAGCASTLAFELSDGAERIVVNCGGAALTGATIPADLARGLRTTAAHSTLILADSNSTALLPDGTLGRGVTEVELNRQELESGSRLDLSHDGYVRRRGYVHRRLVLMSGDGKEIRGEDMLTPAVRRRKPQRLPVQIRFHLAPGVEPTPTADGQGALLRIELGALWQFRAGAGKLTIEDSLWVDAGGRPHATQQLVVSHEALPGGSSIGWLLKRVG